MGGFDRRGLFFLLVFLLDSAVYLAGEGTESNDN